MRTKLVTKTVGEEGTEWVGRTIDEIIVGAARVSTSKENNEKFSNPEGLLRHCLVEGHWSIFEMVNLGIEIVTSRAIGREILRHKMGFQEFSQRYSSPLSFETIELRKPNKNNRQSSDEEVTSISMYNDVYQHINNSKDLYNSLIKGGVARECARFVLPECTQTKIYANATIRVWLSFLNQRLHKATAQKEIVLIAEEVRDIFMKECPIISKMLYNFENADKIHIFDQLILKKYNVDISKILVDI